MDNFFVVGMRCRWKKKWKRWWKMMKGEFVAVAGNCCVEEDKVACLLVRKMKILVQYLALLGDTVLTSASFLLLSLFV